MTHRDDIDGMIGDIEAARRAEAEMFPGDHAVDEIPSSFVRSCLHNNERGDGILFARIHRGKFVQVKNWGKKGVWLYWGGHHWVVDKKDIVIDAVESVALRYLQEAKDLKTLANNEPDKVKSAAYEAERKIYMKRVSKLRSVGGVKNCLEYATTIGDESLSIIADDIDLHPWLFPCANGVIDLRTGKCNDGLPEDYLLRASPIRWEGIDCPCPTWDRFFAEIHEDDQEIIEYLDRLFGYTLTGLTTNHFIGVFLGEGRNGKGTMFETLRHILGELAWNVSPELLIEQKTMRNSAGPSPDLISLQGRRMVIASEADDNRRISGQQVKRLTGADTITARAPHDRDETNITPTWKLFFYTNYIPKGMAADFAMAQRLVYLTYRLKYSESPDPADPFQRKMDPLLPKKILSEASGVLARLVRGCLQWQDMGGLHPPEKIRNAVSDLQKSEDNFSQFFNEMIEVVMDPTAPDRHDLETKTAFKDLYGAFSAWYGDEVSDSDRYRPSKKAVSAWMEKRGFRRSKPCGIAHIHGVRIRIGCDS